MGIEKKMIVALLITCWIIIGIALKLNPFEGNLRRPIPRIYDEGNMKHSTEAAPNSGVGASARIMNYSNSKGDVYDVSGDIRVEGRASTVWIGDDEGKVKWNSSEMIKPIPQKGMGYMRSFARDFKMKTSPLHTIPQCTRKHDTQAILFSTGLVDNHYHRITDVLIPLFATSYHFHRRVVFLIADHDSRLTGRYKEVLDGLSEFEPYVVDNADEIPCFPRLVIGLKSPPYPGLAIVTNRNPSSSFSLRNFTTFMRTVYSLKRASVGPRRRPRALIITRTKSRRLTNHVELADMARTLGFEVVAHDFGESVAAVAELVNSIDVMIGVHGAGLTNMIYLPENALVIQITPLGLNLMAKLCFGKQNLREMKLKYLEYKVMQNESLTPMQYHHNPTFCTRNSLVCLLQQDITLNLPRFAKTLLQALDLFAK